MRTVDFFKIVDLINNVVMEARFAKTVLMLAFAHINVSVFLLSMTNLAITNQAS